MSDFDKEDIEWINKHMEEQFPRFQYSYFPHGKDGEQLVVRGSDFAQFKLDVESVKQHFTAVLNSPIVAARTTAPTAVPAASQVCPVCGSPTVFTETKTGKKLEKCSTSGWDSINKVATGCSYVRWL